MIIGVSLFFANKGYHSKFQIIIKQSSNSATANEYLQGLADTQAKLKCTILKAQQWYQLPTNKKCSLALRIHIRDLIFVLAKFIRTTWSLKKLAECFLGLFEVIGQLGTHSYLIKLLTHLRFVHLVFHISQLELVYTSLILNCVNTLLPPVVVNRDLEFEIEKVLSSKLDHWERDPLIYYV